MDNLNIMHLSDLHLHFEDLIEYENFISRIKETIEKYGKEIGLIAITGDLIDKGETKWFKEFHDKFIFDLSTYTNCPKERIFCVPGNHDAPRDDDVLKKRKEYEEDQSKGINYNINKTQFKKLLARYDEFDKFNSLLHPGITNNNYGVDFCKINNNNVVIVRLNSSVYTHDNDDYKKLGLSKVQLNELTSQYKKIKEQTTIDITIALMHHPDEWLRTDEQAAMWKYFSTNSMLPVDIILHGHTHEGKVSGKIDLDSFVLSLVTGTTYEEGEKANSKIFSPSCRMAFYSIDLSEKYIEGNLYVANTNGEFVPDTFNYNSVDNDGKFEIPYSKVNFNKEYNIKLPFPINNRKRIDNSYIDLLDDTLVRMWKFEKACRLRLDAFKAIPKTKICDEENDFVKDWFTSIAICAQQSFFDSDEHKNVRVHFRKYNGKEHEHFCATIGDRLITPIEWNDGKNLIFHAFEKKRSLVKSLNPDLYFDTKGEWKDFLTVPVWHEMYDGLEIPLYGFGISVKGNNNKRLSMRLELLSLLRIESLIDLVISSFYRNYFK